MAKLFVAGVPGLEDVLQLEAVFLVVVLLRADAHSVLIGIRCQLGLGKVMVTRNKLLLLFSILLHGLALSALTFCRKFPRAMARGGAEDDAG